MTIFIESHSKEKKKKRYFNIMVEDEEGMFFFNKENKYPKYSYLSDKDSLDPIKFIANNEEDVYSHMRDIEWNPRPRRVHGHHRCPG